MSAQVVDDRAYGAAPKRAGVLSAGERFGELTTVRVVATVERGHLWECACDCGRIALRTAAALRRAVKLGYVPACSECNSEARGGRAVERRGARRERLRALWNEGKTLWSAAATERLIRDVCAALDFVPDDGADRRPPFVVHPVPSTPLRGPVQRITHLYPIRDDSGERLWRCHHCGTDVAAGLGCIECLSFVCPACVRAERHVHQEFGDGFTLQEIGDAYEHSPERARQIQEKALRKLRHLSRARELVPFAPYTAERKAVVAEVGEFPRKVAS